MLQQELLTRVTQQERAQGVAGAHVARQAACYRAWCNPTLIDRIAGRLGLSDCAQGTR